MVSLRICIDEDNIDIAFVSVLFLGYLECAVSMASKSTFELGSLQTFEKLISTFQMYLWLQKCFHIYFPSNPLNVIAFKKAKKHDLL